MNHLRGMVVIILFAYALSMINDRKKIIIIESKNVITKFVPTLKSKIFLSLSSDYSIKASFSLEPWDQVTWKTF